MSIFKEKRALLLLNSISFVFSTLRRRYRHLCDLLQQYHVQNEDDEIISTVWDIIDWSDRLRKLLNHGAGINKSEQWYRSIVKGIEPVEKMRNIVQHISGSLEECLRKRTPLFGYLYAFCSGDQLSKGHIVVVLPSGHKAQDIAQNAVYINVGIDFHPPVDHIHFFIGEQRLNVTNLMRLISAGEKNFKK